MQASTKLSLAVIAAAAVTAPVGLALAADPGRPVQARPAPLAAPLAGHRSVGGHGDPAKASVAEQVRRAGMLLARSGPGQWPVCSR